LQEWFSSISGQFFRQNIKLNEEGKIEGWREFVTPAQLDNAYRDGPKYLTDMRKVLGIYGMDNSYAFSTDMLVFEMFVVLV